MREIEDVLFENKDDLDIEHILSRPDPWAGGAGSTSSSARERAHITTDEAQTADPGGPARDPGRGVRIPEHGGRWGGAENEVEILVKGDDPGVWKGSPGS